MGRQIPPSPPLSKGGTKQLALPIGREEPQDVPDGMLREAWRRCRIRQSFEEVMGSYALRTCLRHVAMAMAAKKRG